MSEEEINGGLLVQHRCLAIVLVALTAQFAVSLLLHMFQQVSKLSRFLSQSGHFCPLALFVVQVPFPQFNSFHRDRYGLYLQEAF